MTMTELFRIVIALLVTFLGSGWLLGLVLTPNRLGMSARSLLSLALAVPATFLLSLPGLVTHHLGRASVVAPLLILGALAAGRVALARKQALRPDWPRELVKSVPRNALLLVPGGLAGWFCVLGPQVALIQPDGIPAYGPATWYYWRLVRDVMSHGGLPDTLSEWAGARPFPVEYAVMTVHTAASSLLAGGADLEMLNVYRVAMVVVALAASYALWRRWMPPWWAWVAALVAMSGTYVSTKFFTYVPEAFGLVLVLWSAWLLDEALERRSVLWAAMAGLLSASALLSHAEVWLLTPPVWLGILLSRAAPAVVEWLGKSGRPKGDRDLAGVARTALAGGAALLLFWALGSVVTGGGARVAGLVTGHGITGSHVAAASGHDPTWELLVAMYPEYAGQSAPDICGSLGPALLGSDWFRGVNFASAPRRAVLMLSLLAVLAAAVRCRRARNGLMVWAVYLAGLLVVVGAMCSVYHTYIPERAAWRIEEYGVLAATVLLVGAAAAASVGLRDIVRWVIRGRSRPQVVAGAVGLLATAALSLVLLLALTPAGPSKYQHHGPSISAEGYRALRWMDEHVTHGSVVMANGYTEGSLGAIARVNGWTDGRAPYLEPWRDEAARRLLRAQAFFRDPSANASLLPRRVQYVLVATTPGANLGGTYFPASVDGLMRSPELRLVHDFDGRVLLFRVARRPA